ncbi:ABC transporter permease [Desertimonas flava]|uniref:ABC transporter permease n=1 Tax=Desertimonas flava TaxID=2064846 RepID=UPI000E353A1D|nr:ABC transporter permease [Desertimonas flava]
MLRLILRKIGEAIPVLLLVSLGAAALTDLIPGSPARQILGEFATEERVMALDEKLGVNDPFLERYWRWLSGALRGDLGESLIANEPVTARVLDVLPTTLEVAMVTLVLSLAVALIAALIAASRAEGPVDRGVSGISAFFQAIPSFVAAVFITHLLAVQFGLLPSLGWTPLGENVGEHVKTMIMPVIVLIVVTAPLFYRVARADMVDVLQQDYVLSARARGLSDGYILVRHVLRPASRSLLTLTGLVFGYLIGGSIIVETFFGLPGLGSLVSRSITNQDVVVVQGIVLYVAIAYLVVNLLVDLLQMVLDPRLRSNT